MEAIFQKNKKQILYGNLRTVVILIVVIFMVFFSMIGTYRVLLANARVVGMEQLQNYLAGEERYISAYRMLVKLGVNYMDGLKADHSEEEIAQAMQEYFSKAVAAAGDAELEGYTILNGKILSADGGVVAEKGEYLGTDWYQRLLEADGRIVFTRLQTGNDRIALAAALDAGTRDGVILKIDQGNFDSTHRNLQMPDRGAYYLCDQEGHLLFRNAAFEIDDQMIEAYVSDLWEEIRNGSMDGEGRSITDLSGKTRDLYYATLSNGWLCILTLPHSILPGTGRVLAHYGAVLLLFLAVAGVFCVKSIRLGRAVENTNMIIRALCNSFYAIYRIDLKEGTYLMIKGSDEMRVLLPKSGGYEEMIKGFQTVVDEDTAVALAQSFSLEHVRELAAKGVKDFGGDFLRILNGEERWVNISIIMEDEMLQRDAVVLAFRQIDADKRQQLQHTKLLEHALNAADASERSQKQFFSKMSHELRTPLNIILGMNQLAMQPECPQEKRLDYQLKIEQSGKNMLELINSILEMSRLENGLMPINRKTMNLSEKFAEIVQPFCEKAAQEEKKFDIQIAVDRPNVLGDEWKLAQILNNLLMNAVNFTRKGDQISVTLRQAGRDNNNYIFLVEDTGIGMSEEFLPKIFEPYTQEKQFNYRGEEGSGGLGMAIVKDLVSQKGGQINVESTLGKGTRVVVTLPFEQVADAADDCPVPNSEECLMDMRILVADDNELNRELLCELLEDRGSKVVQAANGEEALKLFEASALFSYDLIIMDMQMPVMDGCQAAENIRKLDRLDAEGVWIIALTANSFSEDVIRTAQAGMDAHLTKPVDMHILQKTVAELIARRTPNLKP